MSESPSSSNSCLVSIVIPTFDRARYLDELLSNLAMQLVDIANTKIEIVVLDNYSTDDTAIVVKRWQARYPPSIPFKYHCQPINIGFAKNVRFGFEIATGRYVWCLCDDDLLEPGTFGRIMAHLRTFATAPLFLLNRNIYNSNMSVVITRNKLAIDRVIEVCPDAAVCQFGGELVTASCVIINRVAAQQGFLLSSYEGYGGEMLCLVLDVMVDSKLVVLGDCIVRYREGNNGSWNALWPWIYIYGIPYVVANSSLGQRNPSLVCKFVSQRKNNLLYACCYIASSKLGWIQHRLEPERLKQYYRDEPHANLFINFAFKSPKWLSRMTLYALASCQLIADEFKARRTRNPLVMSHVPRKMLDKYFRLRQKENTPKAQTPVQPKNGLDK